MRLRRQQKAKRRENTIHHPESTRSGELGPALWIVLDQLGGDSGTGHYRRLLIGWRREGAAFRHAFNPLQREQIRSPHHSLWNAALHLRHRRSLATSKGG